MTSIERICCPGCLTVNSVIAAVGAGKQCKHDKCRLALGWLNHCPKAKEALTKAASGPVELIVRAEWLGGKVTSRHSGDGPFSILAGGQTTGQIAWEEKPTTVKVTIGKNVDVHSLPAEFTDLDGVEYNVCSVAKLGTNHKPPEIHEDANKELAWPSSRPEASVGRVDSNSYKNGLKKLNDVHFVLARQGIDSSETEAGNSRQSGKERQTEHAFWLIDCRSEAQDGTFVNGEPIIARLLRSGDLVQAGPYAWQFSHASTGDAFLRPQRRIHGPRVQFHEAEIRGRLGPLDGIEFAPGTLTAISGPSGSGKSTLLKAVIGEERLSNGRIVLHGDCDSYNVAESPEELRKRLGYVSQALVIHEHLTAREVVRFASKFRGRLKDVDGELIEAALRGVALDEKRWDAKVSDLSGGEQQRVKIAAEAVNSPELFILDEPTSALDGPLEKETLRALHILSRRGATVLVVTHGDRGHFDRTVLLKKGGKLKHVLGPDGKPLKTVGGGTEAKSDDSPVREKGEQARCFRERFKTAWLQFVTHFRRELALLGRNWIWRLLLPLLIVPAMFAVALYVSVPSGKRELLGFLAVLCCIWMGASLSLPSIAEERRVVDHERLLFLNVFPYMTAKTTVLWILSLIQTGIFVVLLGSLIWQSGRLEDFHGVSVWLFVALVVTGTAAVGVGLLLSAVSGRSLAVANFLLPLVMIAQIVFSVVITGGADQHARTYESYDVFTWSTQSEPQVPAIASYLTLSRWGDMAVRPLLTVKRFLDSTEKSKINGYYRQGVGMLVACALLLPPVAGLLVRWTKPVRLLLQKQPGRITGSLRKAWKACSNIASR